MSGKNNQNFTENPPSAGLDVGTAPGRGIHRLNSAAATANNSERGNEIQVFPSFQPTIESLDESIKIDTAIYKFFIHGGPKVMNLLDEFKRLAASGIFRLCAYDSKTMVGYVQGRSLHNVNTGLIQTLSVLPQCQHKGIGSALFRAAEDVLKSRGHENIALYSLFEATQFYKRKHGYKLANRMFGDKGSDCDSYFQANAYKIVRFPLYTNPIVPLLHVSKSCKSQLENMFSKLLAAGCEFIYPEEMADSVAFRVNERHQPAWAYYIGADPVGIIQGGEDPQIIDRLYVAPQWWRRGIGTALIREYSVWARDFAGAGEVALSLPPTDSPFNERAAEFYAAQKFQHIGQGRMARQI